MKKNLKLKMIILAISVLSNINAQTSINEKREQILKYTSEIASLKKQQTTSETKYQRNLLYFEKLKQKQKLLTHNEVIDSLEKIKKNLTFIQHQNNIEGYKREAEITKNYIRNLDRIIFSQKKELQQKGILFKTDINKEISLIKKHRKKVLSAISTSISEKQEMINTLKDSIRIVLKKPLSRNISSHFPPYYIELENPIKGKIRISSPFGYRKHPVEKVKKFHNGIDLVSNLNTVYSAHSGTVKKVDYSPKIGIYIEIISPFGYSTIYGHLSKINVIENQKIPANTKIGRIGNTGNSTGEHLHFIVKYQGKYVNPKNLLNI